MEILTVHFKLLEEIKEDEIEEGYLNYFKNVLMCVPDIKKADIISCLNPVLLSIGDSVLDTPKLPLYLSWIVAYLLDTKRISGYDLRFFSDY